MLRFQSAVLSAFSILSLAMNPATGDAAFGFADGTVKIFTIQKEGSFARQLAVVDVAKHLRKAADQTSNANQVWFGSCRFVVSNIIFSNQ